MSSPAIIVTGLVKQFGRSAALRGVSADFLAGRIYAVLGENGAGKTTLLRTLAGISTPTKGSVSMLGSSDVLSMRAEFGYMAHPSMLYDELSGMENLRYFGRLYGIDDDARFAGAMKTVDLDPSLDRPAGKYSQGMRQRLSLVRALLHDPKILLLDEPFSNIDVSSSGKMILLLSKMRDDGKTILIVTHQAALLTGVADEFISMEAGRIIGRDDRPPSSQENVNRR